LRSSSKSWRRKGKSRRTRRKYSSSSASMPKIRIRRSRKHLRHLREEKPRESSCYCINRLRLMRDLRDRGRSRSRRRYFGRR
jgi:peptide methionine sulfoxide reductase MsrB